MKKFAFIFIVILGLSLYFLFPDYDSSSNFKNQDTKSFRQTSVVNIKTLQTDNDSTTVKSLESTVSPQKTGSPEKAQSKAGESTQSLDERLEYLQSQTTMDLSTIDEGLKYALLDGSATLLPSTNGSFESISIPATSSYVPDMLTHPSFEKKLPQDEYFTQDSNSTVWAREAENQFSKALNSSEFQKQFTHLTIYDFSCRDTVCRVSIEGKVAVPSQLTKYFTYIPALGTPYGGRSTSISHTDEGNTEIYIWRSMTKEPLH